MPQQIISLKYTELVSERAINLAISQATVFFANNLYLPLDSEIQNNIRKSVDNLIDSRMSADDPQAIYEYEIFDIVLHHIYPLIVQASGETDIDYQIGRETINDPDEGEGVVYTAGVELPPLEGNEDETPKTPFPLDNPFPLPQGAGFPSEGSGNNPGSGSDPGSGTQPRQPRQPSTGNPTQPRQPRQPTTGSGTSPDNGSGSYPSIPDNPYNPREDNNDSDETNDDTDENESGTGEDGEDEDDPGAEDKPIGLDLLPLIYEIKRQGELTRGALAVASAQINGVNAQINATLDRRLGELVQAGNAHTKAYSEAEGKKLSTIQQIRDFLNNGLYKLDQTLGKMETGIVSAIKGVASAISDSIGKWIETFTAEMNHAGNVIYDALMITPDDLMKYICEGLQWIETFMNSCTFFKNNKADK